jgi:hypothetical protein
LPADKNATGLTIHLYRNLKELEKKGILFGHQDDPAYGVGWKDIPGKSDVKEVTGDYPAVYGFELGRIELDHAVNIDGVPFDKIRAYIREVYKRGGVITLSWHLNNPLTGKSAWDTASGTIASILPGGTRSGLYKGWLEKVSHFIFSLRTEDGQPIPIILRLFHEWNGDWFWWGRNYSTPEEFMDLWHFTVSYIRDTMQVHQLLYAFNTDRFASTQAYLSQYPGDDWADIIGFDIYQRKEGAEGNAGFVHDADTMLTMLERMAAARHKIAALTEFGYGQVKDSTWWTKVFYRAIGKHKISYALAWRNAGRKASGQMEYYLPYQGQISQKDFVSFYHEPNIFFQKEVTKADLYK